MNGEKTMARMVRIRNTIYYEYQTADYYLKKFIKKENMILLSVAIRLKFEEYGIIPVFFISY